MFPQPLSLSDPGISDEERQQREAVVAEARSWMRTPYHWLADQKGVGVDCAMLLVRVYVDTGVLAPFDPRPYPPMWHLHRNEEKFLGWLFQLGQEVERPRVGDVVIAKFGKVFSHGAIVVNERQLIHAHLDEKTVLLLDLHHPVFETRKIRFFNVWSKPNAPV